MFARVAFGVWLLATALHQFPQGRRITRYVDFAGLALPIWTFFAPFPGTQDAELLYRTRRRDDAASSWRHLPIYEERRLSHVLVHFNRRLEKTVFDATSEVKALLREQTEERLIQMSGPYLTLLNIVQSEASMDGEDTGLQFMLVDSGGYDDHPLSLSPLFASNWHRIERRVDATA